MHYDSTDRQHVTAMKYSVCISFKDRLLGYRNYSPGFINGSSRLCTSAFKDHTGTEMHQQKIILKNLCPDILA